MKTNVYAIYDKKAETYSSPFLAQNNSVAVRMVRASMDSTSLLSQFSDDYRLDLISEYDDTFGTFINKKKQVCIMEVSNIAPMPFDDGVMNGANELVENN